MFSYVKQQPKPEAKSTIQKKEPKRTVDTTHPSPQSPRGAHGHGNAGKSTQLQAWDYTRGHPAYVSAGPEHAAPGRVTVAQRKQTKDTIQLRDENTTPNPYKKTGETLGGKELTAHHIVPFSLLDNSLMLLSAEDQKEIIMKAIPRELTADVLKKFGLVTDDWVEGDYTELRLKLLDMSQTTFKGTEKIEMNPETIVFKDKEIDLTSLRMSFFLWQKGNQFYGANTQMRVEPGAKDDIDTDGKYFFQSGKSSETDQAGAGKLIRAGTDLKREYENTKNKMEIKKHLSAILDVTVEGSGKSFDASDWVELDSSDKIELVKKGVGGIGGRANVKEFSFFKVLTSKMGANNEYDMMTFEHGNCKYGGIEIAATTLMDSVLIKIHDAEQLKTVKKEKKQVRAILSEIGTIEGETVTVPTTKIVEVPIQITKGIFGKKISLKDCPNIAFINKETDVGEGVTSIKNVSEKELNKEVDVTSNYKKLDVYLNEKKAPTTGYIPRGLYDDLLKEKSKTDKIISDAAKARSTDFWGR